MAKTKTTPPVKKKRKAGAKEGYLPGAEFMSPPVFRDLDEAAEDYRAARDARMQMGKTEQEAAETLLKKMQARGLTEYEYDGKLVRVVDLVKVKVNKVKNAHSDDNGKDE